MEGRDVFLRIISALANQEVQDNFKKIYGLEFLSEDCSTQEDVLRLLKESCADVLILSEKLAGSLDIRSFIDTIQDISKSTRIILIAKEESGDWTSEQGICDVFVDGRCTYDDIYSAIVKRETGKKTEKGKVVVRVEKETILVGFKKLILTVFGCPEFACEFSYTAARLSSLNVLLIDLDTLNATADIFLNVKKHNDRIKCFDDFESNSGLNICLDAADKKELTGELFVEACEKKLKNLYVLPGNYKLSNFEYYSIESLIAVLEKAYEYFDITVLAVSPFIYDAFTFAALKKSDCNIFPVRADRAHIREINRYLVLLKEKQNMELSKSKFVAYEYDPATDLPKGVLKELTGGNFIGCISYSQKRRRYRNLKPIFAKNMDRKTLGEYADILSKFNITPKRQFGDKVADLFKPLLRKIKKLTNGRRGRHASA